MKILEMVDWKNLSSEPPYRFHGDLHFENILVNDTNSPPFTLLDWRQDYAGNLEYGDIYYDFAKLNHGLIICHELINKDLYEVQHRLSVIDYDFLRKSNLVECEIYFREYINQTPNQPTQNPSFYYYVLERYYNKASVKRYYRRF